MLSSPQMRERGQVVVLMALFLPVFFAMGAVVLDVGNWYVHKRHLQTQVDAAALAGGTKFTGCSSLFDPAGANLAIKGTALEYAGDDLRAPDTIDPTFGSTVRNQQVEQPGDVRVVINSSDYWSQGDPTDGSSLDDTQDLDGDGSGDPCNERAVDAKATDDEVPNIFGVSWGTSSRSIRAPNRMPGWRFTKFSRRTGCFRSLCQRSIRQPCMRSSSTR